VSVTNEPSASARTSGPGGRFAYPKARRILKRAEFRQVYEAGFRVTAHCFVAFCWKSPVKDGPKVGFTVPRGLGKAVVRNRMRRRLRETVRRNLGRIAAEWRIVWNLRRGALDAPQAVLDSEVEKVIVRCVA
jgi:ribonuclease P protein component